MDTNHFDCNVLSVCWVAGQLGLRSSRPLSQVGPRSTGPESTRPSVFSECLQYGLGFA